MYFRECRKHSYWGDLYTYSKENTLNFNPELQFGAQNLGAIRGFKEGYSLEKMKNNFDEFLKITQKDENVEYDIYFPPYASLWWYFAYKYDCLDTILEFKKYIIDSVENKENIKIYDFQTDYEIVENLDNYKDIVHYGPKINREILMDIKDSKNLVDTELYSESENKFIEKMKIWEFEFKEFKDL